MALAKSFSIFFRKGVYLIDRKYLKFDEKLILYFGGYFEWDVVILSIPGNIVKR